MAFNFSKPAPQDQADLASSIQQLTSATSSTLQNTQASCMEDALVHLETTDENFHRYMSCTISVTAASYNFRTTVGSISDEILVMTLCNHAICIFATYECGVK